MEVGILTRIGTATLTRLAALGRAAFFVGRVLGLVFVPPLKGRLILRQMHFIGARSVLVIVLTGAFAGMVLGLQGFHVLTRFGSEALLGQFVSLTLITELGPVFSAIMVTARAGSAITAQIGIMRITEQLDAMTVMALNPLRYVAVPNVAAGALVMPLLGAMFSVVGIYGGYLAGVLILGVNRGHLLRRHRGGRRPARHHQRHIQIAVLRNRRAAGVLFQGLPCGIRRRGASAARPRRPW